MLKTIVATCALALIAGVGSAQTLERIRDTGALNIGFRSDAPPLSYINTDGEPAGYSPMVCAEVARGLARGLEMENLTITFVPVTAADRFDRVASGELDLHCGAATITLRRLGLVDFSIPVYVDGAAAMLPADAITGMEGLAGKKIGVRADTTTEEALNNTLKSTGIDAEVVVVENHAEGVDGMLAGALQAYFADQSILMGLEASRDKDNKLVVMDRLLTIEKQGLAMARGDADFRLAVDSILSDMFAAGIMQDIFAQTLPGARPGKAMEALYLLAPTLD